MIYELCWLDNWECQFKVGVKEVEINGSRERTLRMRQKNRDVYCRGGEDNQMHFDRIANHRVREGPEMRIPYCSGSSSFVETYRGGRQFGELYMRSDTIVQSNVYNVVVFKSPFQL